MTDELQPTNPAPAAAAAKRGRGRPPGAKNRPRPTGPQSPQPVVEPDPLPTDDKVADKLAAAATSRPDNSTDPGRPTRRVSERRALAEQLTTAYTGIGEMLKVAGTLGVLAPGLAGVAARAQAVGAELVKNADKCGQALAEWADTNPRVKAWLSNLSTGSGFLLVLAAHGPIIGALFGKVELGQVAGSLLDQQPTDDSNPFAMFGPLLAAFGNGTNG